MADLFTEEQWRAASKVEEFTEDDYRRTPDRLEGAKRLLGPTFSGGEYYVARGTHYIHPVVFGPPVPFYTVYERRSYLVLTGKCESVAEAVDLARIRMGLIPHAFYARLFEEAKAEHEKMVAEEEARKADRPARQVKPRAISKRARAVFEASGGKCHYCEAALTLDGKWHIEHKFPRALFGGSEQDNLVAACAPCNMAKRDRTDLEFIAMRAAQPQLTQAA